MFVEFNDILNEITTSDSECEVLSSEDELDDESWEPDNIIEVVESQVDGGNDDSDDVEAGDICDNICNAIPIPKRKKQPPKAYKFEERRPFVPPQLPAFTPEPEKPIPEERIPVEYVHMFLTNDMVENLVTESNKYATEKTGVCPNFTKEELQTYIGIYYMMGIVRLPKIDDY